MNYSIVIEKRARQFISKQPKTQRERLLKAIAKLPEEGDIKPLAGRNGFFRLRVGDYRVIYYVENDRFVVVVIDAGNRGQIYKTL
ncbi:MAG: type II toxin-antitoxin system RelE/ParE family toxin [Lachnospiraceae bacterium]|nr:type II toxin-antitoxin system RelE/ParE family toxin [Lachnospiraceae bacterium]